MTRTGGKEEGGVCGDVRRRKNLVNLTKRLSNRVKTVGGRSRRERRSFHREDAHSRILRGVFFLLAVDNYSLLPFRTRPTYVVAANFLLSWQVRCSGNTGQCFALWKKLGDERWKVSRGGQRYGFTKCFGRITRVNPDFCAWHWSTLSVGFGIYLQIRADAGWLWNSKLKKKKSQRLDFFPFFAAALYYWRHSSLWIQLMLSPPLSVHAKTEISTILVLPGKCSLHGIKKKNLMRLQSLICQGSCCHTR